MNESKDIVTTVTRKTKLQNFDLDIMYFVLASHNRVGEEENYTVQEIVSINKDLTANEITFELRYQRDYNIVYIQGYSCVNDTIGLNYCTNGVSGLPSGIGTTEYVEVE